MSKAGVCIVKVAERLAIQKPLGVAPHQVGGAPQEIEHMVYTGELTAREANLLLAPMPNNVIGFERQPAANVIEFIDTMINEGYMPEEIIQEVRKRYYDYARMNPTNRARANRGEEIIDPKNVINTINKAVDGHARFVRATMMYNAANGVKSTLSDMLGIASHFIFGGQYGALYDLVNGNGIRRVAALAKDPESFPKAFSQDTDSLLAAAGINLPNNITQEIGVKSSMFGGKADELPLPAAVRNRGRLTRTAASVIQSERVMKTRNAMELNGRGTLGLAVYRDNQYIALSRFRSYLKRNNLDPEATIDAIMYQARVRTGLPQPETFSVDDVTNAFLGYTPIPNSPLAQYNGLQVINARTGKPLPPKEAKALVNNLARAWAQEQDWLLTKVKDVNKDLLFTSSRRLPGESAMSKVFYFHYWMLRASALQARKTLGNPLLLYNYMKMWHGAQNEAEKNGYPKSFTGMIKYWNNEATGLFALINPLGVVIPAMMFSDIFTGTVGDDAQFWDYADSILPMTPMFNAALAIIGLSDRVPDPIGTRGNIEGVVRSMVQWGAVNGIDFTDNGSKPTENIVENVVANLTNLMNDAARFVGLTDNDYEPYISSMGRQDTVKSIALQMMTDEWGPPETWTPEQLEEARRTLNSITSGSEATRISKAAISMYGNAVLGNEIANRFIPGGSVLRYGPRDVDRMDARQGDTSANIRRDLAMASTESTDILVGRMQATQAVRQVMGDDYRYIESYNLISDGFPDKEKYADTGYVKIGGRTITVSQLRAMTYQQRRALADQWATERGITPYIERARTIQNAANSANPNAAINSYKDYQNMVGDWAGDVRGFREWARISVPNWKDAEDSARRRFAARGATGEVLEAEMDGWAFSVESYQAFRGAKNKIYDDRPGNASAGRQVLGQYQQIGGGSYGRQDTAAMIRRDLERQSAVGGALNTVGPLAGLVTGFMGIRPPGQYASPYTSQFLLWQQANPNGSPEEFVQWMISQGMEVSTYDQLPEYFRQ